MRTNLVILTASLAAGLAAAGTARATTFEISTLGGNTLNGSAAFRGGDIVRYNDATGTVTQIFDEDVFDDPGVGPEVDAFELLPNGNMVFSTTDPSILGTNALGFVDGDIVEYDPVNDLATLIFDEQANFNGQADIDAVAVLPNGHILFSTEDDENLTGGPSISDGDVVEWDPLTDSFVGIYVSEATLFGGADADIDAFDVTAEGNYALSTDAAASIGLLGFSGSDLVLYDINTDTAIIWVSATLFGDPSGSPLDAVAVPEPSAATLLALGLVGLAFAGRRRPR